MQIRLATHTDKPKVLALLDELGEEINKRKGFSPTNAQAQEVGGPMFDEIITNSDTHIFVAEEDGQLYGLATFYVLPNIRHGYKRGHIEDFVVSEKSRGKGVGSMIMDEIKKYCQKNNIKVIKLDSGVELIFAHKFYEKHGGKNTEKMFRFDI